MCIYKKYKNIKNMYTHVCEFCNKTFSSKKKTQRFCSHECANARIKLVKILIEILQLKLRLYVLNVENMNLFLQVGLKSIYVVPKNV